MAKFKHVFKFAIEINQKPKELLDTKILIDSNSNCISTAWSKYIKHNILNKDNGFLTMSTQK